MKKFNLYILLLLLPLLSCVDSNEEVTVNYINVGDRLPAFSLTGPVSPHNSISSADFEGKKGLVVLFASYCPDCQRIMGKIQDVWDKLGGNDDYAFAVISRVWGDETGETVAEYWEKNGYTMPYYLDYEKRVYELFANRTIPRVYVTDTEGTVRFMSVGKLDETAQQLADIMRSQE